MLRRIPFLPLERPERQRLGVFVLCGVAAFALGFVLISPPTIEALIVAGGYYYILALFAAFTLYAWRVAAARREVWSGWCRRPGWIGLALLGATAFTVWSDSFAHKVLFDEYVLQGTAWHMHATKEIGAPIRAYEFQGTWLAIDAFLDKRPYFFTFLISLLHDLTGFRIENAYALNVALSGLTLGLTYWLVRAMTGRRAPALFSVALLATLPLFGQNATGASMELHNLAMIAVVMVCAILYLRRPDADRLSLLVLGAALLAQCRYESVLFVLPVAGVIALGWWQRRQVLLPWAACIAPLLLVPYAWLDRFVQSKPMLWQLRAGDTARFGWRYLEGNLEGAWHFFFNLSPGQPSSVCLTLLGLAGLGWAVVRMSRWSRQPAYPRPVWRAEFVVCLLFGGIVAANLGVLMFYYWSRLDEIITARFALPFYFMLALLAGWGAHSIGSRGWPALRIGGFALAAWLAVVGAPAYARRLYTSQNLVMRELYWELEQVAAHPGPVLVITSKATMPYLLQRIPAVNTGLARSRGPEIAWHMAQGTFHEVLVAQVLRPTSGEGNPAVEPEDALPASFELQPVACKRFGVRWIQISRVAKVAAAAVTATPSPPPAPAAASFVRSDGSNP
jgi:hypothetical protein